MPSQRLRLSLSTNRDRVVIPNGNENENAISEKKITAELWNFLRLCIFLPSGWVTDVRNVFSIRFVLDPA